MFHPEAQADQKHPKQVLQPPLLTRLSLLLQFGHISI